MNMQYEQVIGPLRAHQFNASVSPHVREDGHVFYPCSCGEWAEDLPDHQAENLTTTTHPDYHENPWATHMRTMLGKQVKVTIDIDHDVTITGQLVMFDDGGEVALRSDDGFTNWAWPNQETELIP